MFKCQPVSVQRLVGEARERCATVKAVTGQWMPRMGEVHPDLVSSPGMQAAVNQADRLVVYAAESQRQAIRCRGLTVFADRHAQAVLCIAADGTPGLKRTHMTEANSKVFSTPA
jgi:hypothetical protein